MMRTVLGIAIPEDDKHFEKMIKASPLYDGAGTYQLNKMEEALSYVKRFDCAMDIGAHVGLWSRVLADKFDRVLAFEPVKAFADCWRRNLRTSPNASLFELALGEESRAVSFVKVDGNSGNSHVSQIDDKKGGTRVNMARLDSFKFPAIDFLKIDVEGFELFVLRGGEKTIREAKPVIIIEQKPDNAERYAIGRWDATKLLRDWGMREVRVLSGDHIMVWR